MAVNTLCLRLEGPLQAWGSHESKFAVRRTMDAPTKSGIIGLLCAAMGLSRHAARDWLEPLAALRMGVRTDRSGIRWWDYHTVGAGFSMRIAEGEGKTKLGPLLSRREYLCDASFLVALQGEPDLIGRLHCALEAPCWTPYLGRKCCPPARPILERPPAECADLLRALASVPWQPRMKSDKPPDDLECLLDWCPSQGEPEAPPDAEVWYDVPTSFAPPSRIPRFVIRRTLTVGDDGDVIINPATLVAETPRPPRPRADYSNSQYRQRRAERLDKDAHLCVFCKASATTVQHITYRRAGGDEDISDLKSLCRLCHDAITMLEYGAKMGLDRIDPEDVAWRERIIAKRREIIAFRSLAARQRHLGSEKEDE